MPGIFFPNDQTRFFHSWDIARCGSLIAITTKPTKIDFGQIVKALLYEVKAEYLSLNSSQKALEAKNINSYDPGTIHV